MIKSQPDNDFAPLASSDHGSISSGQLTAKRKAELIRLFGAKLEEGYQQLIVEPLPDHWKLLLAKLGAEAEAGK